MMSVKREDPDLNDLAEYSSDEDIHEGLPKKNINSAVSAQSFQDLMLKADLVRAIRESGFETPSEVQQECIPLAISGQDIIAQAKSGMGKTAVFVLSVLHQLNPVPGEIQCIVLCHVHELATQIKSEFDRFKKYLPNVTTMEIYGKVPVSHQIQQLKTEVPTIVVGTPGRVLHLVKEGHLNLRNIKFFVLDECDRMLEQVHMRSDVQEIFKLTPRNKQTMMFSATLRDELRSVGKKFMRDPKEVYINDGSKLDLDGLEQYYVQLEESKKNQQLSTILDSLDFNQVIIFVKSLERARTLGKVLRSINFPTLISHGDLSQYERSKIYSDFKAFQSRILVSTDLYGRGVDFERVNLVINYDMPRPIERRDQPYQNPTSEAALVVPTESYLHRIARAGRFGTKGVAISFVCDEVDGAVINSVQAKLSREIPPMPEVIRSLAFHNSK